MRRAPSESVQAAAGRRRREASAAEILAATRRLLSAGDPIGQLSVERILAEAGVSRATFYACFPDKHAVIGRLAEESLAWREQVSGEALADRELTRPRLDELMRAIVGHWRANRPVLAAIIELAEHDPAMRDAWRSAVDQIAAQTARHLRARWADSPDAPSDPAAVATALTWMFERCAHQLAVDDESAETVALALSEILWRTVTYQVACV
jgi:AcrR family transcriptional regulator